MGENRLKMTREKKGRMLSGGSRFVLPVYWESESKWKEGVAVPSGFWLRRMLLRNQFLGSAHITWILWIAVVALFVDLCPVISDTNLGPDR